MKNFNLVLFTLALILLLFGFGMINGFAAPISNQEPSIERQGQRGSWQYRAAVDRTEGRIVADVTYSLDTAAQVEDFARTQQELASELVSANVLSLDATIVFRHPLTQAVFEEFVATHNLTVSSYTLRFVDEQDQRITIIGSPVDNTLIPQDFLNFALNDIQQRSPGDMPGWIEVRATIPARAYKSVVDHDKVYLIDVSRAVVQAAFKEDAQTRNLPVYVQAPQIYWQLEDLHLVPN